MGVSIMTRSFGLDMNRWDLKVEPYCGRYGESSFSSISRSFYLSFLGVALREDGWSEGSSSFFPLFFFIFLGILFGGIIKIKKCTNSNLNSQTETLATSIIHSFNCIPYPLPPPHSPSNLQPLFFRLPWLFMTKFILILIILLSYTLLLLTKCMARSYWTRLMLMGVWTMFATFEESIEFVIGSSVTLIYKFDKKDSNNYNSIKSQFQWQTSRNNMGTEGPTQATVLTIRPRQISHALETGRPKLMKNWSIRARYAEITRNMATAPTDISASLPMEPKSWDATMATIHSTKQSFAPPSSTRNTASTAIDATSPIKTKPNFPSRSLRSKSKIWIVTGAWSMRLKPWMGVASSPAENRGIPSSEQLII